MKSWSIFDPQTGLFSPKSYSGPGHWRPRVPEGMALLEGEYDHLSQRVDIATGKVVDYQPRRPDDDHEWNADRKRWKKRPEVEQREMQRADTMNRIAALEARQHRRVRELLAASDPMLTAITEEISALRAKL